MKPKAHIMLSVLLVLCFLLPVHAEVTVAYERREQHGAVVIIPELSGMVNTFVQDRINQAIFDRGDYAVLLANLAAVTAQGGGAVNADAQAYILPGQEGQDVLAVRMEATGKVGPGRPSHRVRGLMVQLSTGEEVTAEDIFLDLSQAEEAIAGIVEQEITSDISAYLNPDAFFPLPMDNMLLDATGISLFYEADQLSLLSGRSGSLHLHYDEVLPLLNMQEGSVLWQLNTAAKVKPGEATAASIEEDAVAGRLPGIPVTLGQSAQDVFNGFPRASDSMSFPGALRYQLEDDRFRGTYIIMDAGSVTGIITRRMNLHGLILGQASGAEVQNTLGEPFSALFLDAPAAEQYGLPTGVLKEYRYDARVLRMLFDEADILAALWLSDLGS